MRLLLCALLFAGCNGDFDPASYLDKLRLLDIHADPPEVGQGESATLTPLYGQFGAGMRDFTFEWAICRRSAVPGAGKIINPDCYLETPQDYLVPLGTSETMSVTMPMLASPLELGIPDETGGLYLPVRLILRVSGEQEILAFYRLRLALTPARNHNPTLDRLYAIDRPDGGTGTFIASDEATPIETDVGAELHLQATIRPGDLETFQQPVGNLADPASLTFETVHEEIRMLWFASSGLLSPDTTGERLPMPGEVIDEQSKEAILKLDDKHPPASGDLIQLYVVMHDGRGGSTSAHRVVHVR